MGTFPRRDMLAGSSRNLCHVMHAAINLYPENELLAPYGKMDYACGSFQRFEGIGNKYILALRPMEPDLDFV